LIADNVLASALGFFFWIIAARFYVESDVGIASTLISSMTLLSIASTLGFTVGLIRFLPQAKAEYSSKIINSCFTVSGILALILASVFIIGLDIWSPPLRFLKNDVTIAVIFVLFTLAMTFTTLLNGIFISARKAEYVLFKNSMIFSVLKLVLLMILSGFALMLTYFNIYFSWGIATIIAVLISLLILVPRMNMTYRPRISIDRKSIDHMMRFSLGNYIAIFFGNAPILILPLMITNILGSDVTAYFYLTWMMASLLFIVTSAVGTSLLSEMSHEEMKYDEKAIKAAKFIALLLVPGIILFLLFGDKFLLLFGASYSDNASAALQIFAISALPHAVNGLFVTVKNAKKEVRYVILVNAIIALGTLVSSYFLMNFYGLYGIAIAWISIQSIVACGVISTLIFKRKFG
jgi:O-antigen/teichoic acid export membrane protein